MWNIILVTQTLPKFVWFSFLFFHLYSSHPVIRFDSHSPSNNNIVTKLYICYRNILLMTCINFLSWLQQLNLNSSKTALFRELISRSATISNTGMHLIQCWTIDTTYSQIAKHLGWQRLMLASHANITWKFADYDPAIISFKINQTLYNFKCRSQDVDLN